MKEGEIVDRFERQLNVLGNAQLPYLDDTTASVKLLPDFFNESFFAVLLEWVVTIEFPFNDKR